MTADIQGVRKTVVRGLLYVRRCKALACDEEQSEEKQGRSVDWLESVKTAEEFHVFLFRRADCFLRHRSRLGYNVSEICDLFTSASSFYKHLELSQLLKQCVAVFLSS